VKYATKLSPTLAGESGKNSTLPSWFTTTARLFPYTTTPGVPVAGMMDRHGVAGGGAILYDHSRHAGLDILGHSAR